MDYFNIKAIQDYSNHVGKRYDKNSDSAKCYYDTREKLKYLSRLLGKKLGVSLMNNYNEQPNKQAGQGKPFVLKEYILTGFIPNQYDIGKSIFLKLSFFFNNSIPRFGVDVDINFKKDNNPYRKDRSKLQKETGWNKVIDSTFPTNWNDLEALIFPLFESNINYLHTYLQNQQRMEKLNEFIALLKFKNQIILQGPPGTGKTYEAKNIAKQLIRESMDNPTDEKLERALKEQMKIVQFHPSYTYEDFVRGIMINSETGSYETEDKTLMKFAEKALKDSADKTVDISKEEWLLEQLTEFASYVQGEIDAKGKFVLNTNVSITEVEEDAFRYIGENWKGRSHRMRFSDLKILYLESSNSWRDVRDNQNVSGSARQHAAYYNIVLGKLKEKIGSDFSEQSSNKITASKPYILIIDEINRANLPSVLGELIYALEYRGEPVDSIYATKKGDRIILPSNLYIIGTMNTADRSVGHVDYAIRRRFAFKNMLPDVKVIEGQPPHIKNQKATDLFLAVEDIFKNHLSTDFQKDDVQLGHSYFLGKEEDLSMRFKYEIKPILMEYLKDGIFVESAKAAIENLSV